MPGLLAGRVFSCQIALLLRRSDIEASGWLCLSCAKLALHSPMHPIVDKAQPVVYDVQVTPDLGSHAMLNTSGRIC